MQVLFSAPDRINDVWPLESGSSLTADELRRVFPVIVTAQCDGAAIVLRDAPMLGVVEQWVEASDRLFAGEGAATMFDFYGEYEIELRREREAIAVVEMYSGQRLRVASGAFYAAVAQAVHEAFDAIAQGIPSVESNAAWVTMRARCFTTCAAWSRGR